VTSPRSRQLKRLAARFAGSIVISHQTANIATPHRRAADSAPWSLLGRRRRYRMTRLRSASVSLNSARSRDSSGAVPVRARCRPLRCAAAAADVVPRDRRASRVMWAAMAVTWPTGLMRSCTDGVQPARADQTPSSSSIGEPRVVETHSTRPTLPSRRRSSGRPRGRRYLDVLEPRDGHWRILTRRIVVDTSWANDSRRVAQGAAAQRRPPAQSCGRARP